MIFNRDGFDVSKNFRKRNFGGSKKFSKPKNKISVPKITENRNQIDKNFHENFKKFFYKN